VVAATTPGKKIVDLCALGDGVIEEGVAAVFKGQAEKGVAFPTCISANHCVGHFSPFRADTVALQEGDVVKV
jgi:methionine aminopeptidase